MGEVVGVPLICRILLTFVFAQHTTLLCYSQHTKSADHHSLFECSASQSKLSVMDLIDSILKRLSVPTGNSNITIHIDNLYCVTGSQEVQINPCKQQSVNLARGDQVVSLENPRELTKRSLPRKAPPLGKHAIDCHSSGGPQVNRERDLQSDDLKLQSDEPWTRSGGYMGLDQTLTGKTRSEGNNKLSENQDSFHLDIPALNVYIDGKQVTDSLKPKTPGEALSSKLFKEDVRALLLESSTNSVGKRLLCDREEPPCDDETLTFKGGLELSYEQFRKIIDDVSERPDFIKLIVPGGVTGPLSGYFQKVDKSLHEHALIHGVCLLDNGLLVPLRAMLRILKLHAWLCEMVPGSVSEDVDKLHSSIKRTQTDRIVDLLRCFIKSNHIHVVLPGTSKVPFAQFEQEEENIPKDLQKRAKVEMLGFNIPYINFRDKLVALCQDKSN